LAQQKLERERNAEDMTVPSAEDILVPTADKSEEEQKADALALVQMLKPVSYYLKATPESKRLK
jgi:hypothetical protein